MQRKRFRSIIHEVIILPLIVMVTITVITIISSIISYQNMEEKLTQGNLNSLQIALSQLDNLVSQIDSDFIQYVTTSDSYFYMHDYDRNTPKSKYFRYEAQTTNWLSSLASGYGDVKGVFAYYENMELLLFRGNNAGGEMAVHKYVKKQLQSRDLRYSHMSIVKISGAYYLLYTKKYGSFCGGCWIPVKSLYKKLGLDNGNLLGTVYIMDSANANTLGDPGINSYMEDQGIQKKNVEVSGKRYTNYRLTARSGDFYFGLLMPNASRLGSFPMFNRIIFVIVILSVLMVPVLLYWLQRKIARPLKVLDDAMKMIGNGERDYRIPVEDIREDNEYTRLMERFNQMMDELNELEISLFKTKIREQRTKLKYISQQIRPHFILNALNLIYTYDPSEFDLAKKMVLYLTKYFRYIVNLQVDFVLLEKDFQHVETYLQIQKERYLDRLDYVVEWESQVGGVAIPPLIVQTFVENCIKYAIKNEEKLFIFVLARELEGRLKLSITDTGNGFREETLGSIQRFVGTRVYQDNLGIGIQNAIERMDILYQERVEIKVSNAPTGGAVVEISLPLHG
ncbi:MAG TPA: histidine kinase [Clostridiales bacterium]|nr:histidine kinase [Clostridiales bacterium]